MTLLASLALFALLREEREVRSSPRSFKGI
jgi:hypothetical protein